jgi:hypothetical protein
MSGAVLAAGAAPCAGWTNAASDAIATVAAHSVLRQAKKVMLLLLKITLCGVIEIDGN